MSVEIQVSMPNLPELVGRLHAFRQDQLPFALSLAMNRAARDAQFGVEDHMRKKFKLRSTHFPRTFGPYGEFAGRKSNVYYKLNEKTGLMVRYGKTSDERAAQAIRNGWSHRTQWPNLEVRIGSVAHATALQEVGGYKPFSGQKDGAAAGPGDGNKPSKARAGRAWIPTKYLPRDGAKIARNYQPARIRERLKATRRGSKATDTVWEKGKFIMRRQDGSNEVRPIYLLATKAVVPERLYFRQYVIDTYNAKLWPRFSQAMASALKSARNNRFTKS